MNRSSLRRTAPLTLAIVAILILMVAACGATPTATPVPPTAVPPTATKAAVPTATTATSTAPTSTTGTTGAAPTATTAPAAPTATKAAATSTVSFAKDVLPILQKNCTRCHAGNSPKAGLTMESYASVMKGSVNGTVVTAGSPDKSPLYTLVKTGVMPFGGSKLPDADAQKIFDWIQAGAQNN